MVVRPIVHFLVSADYSLVVVEPAEQSGVEAMEDMLAVVADMESAIGDKIPLGGATSVVEEEPSCAEVDIPLCVVAPTTEFDEGEVMGAVSLAVDHGPVDVAAEHVADGAVGADGEAPPPRPAVLDEAEDGTADTNVLDEVSVDGVPPEATEEQMATLEVEMEVEADLVIVQGYNDAIEEASEPAETLVTELEPEPEPEPAATQVAEQAAELATEARLDNWADLSSHVAVRKGPEMMEDDGKLMVKSCDAVVLLLHDFACHLRICPRWPDTGRKIEAEGAGGSR